MVVISYLYQSRKICVFQKVPKTTTSTPHPPSSKLERSLAPLFSHSREEIEEKPCVEEGGVQIFFLIATIISLLRRKSAFICLKQQSQPPTLPPAKSKVFSRRYFLTAARRSRSNHAWKKVGYGFSF